jgi:dTDP-4-dehydrorhamnose 3,5-epimerase
MPEAQARDELRFHSTDVAGAYVVEIDPIEDERGFFARGWCAREFAENGLHATFVQENVGFSGRAGTLRGMHFQQAPHEEAKLVRCTAGAVWDVAVDLRERSPTYRRWAGVELSAADRNMLFVPEGCAHGYLTLTDSAETRYLTSQYYAPEAASGVRYDDPALGIRWPADVVVVSEADRGWPLLETGGEEPEA